MNAAPESARVGDGATHAGPTLETPRLILRPPVADDLDGFALFAADPEASRFFGGPQPRAAAWRLLALFAGGWALQGFGMFSVIERATGRWIGRVGPWCPEGWPGTEVGWGLLSSAWGRGFAAEAGAAAIDWAVDRLGWDGVVHLIDPANIASIALAERLGATYRGERSVHAAQGGKTVGLWGQGAADWRARRARTRSSRR